MSGSMESSASWDREVSEDAAADPFASAEGVVALLTRMSDDDELEAVDPDLDEGEDGLLDDPEAADDDEDALLEGDDELDDELAQPRAPIDRRTHDRHQSGDSEISDR